MRNIVLLLLFASLAGCSPYSFQKEVTSFDSGVDQLSSAFTSGFSALASDRQAKLQRDLTKSRGKVSMTSSCLAAPSDLAPDAPPCELFPAGATPPGLSEIEKTRGKTTVVLSALKAYADALAAVTNAADRAAFNNAVAQLSGSVGALANAAGAVVPGASTVAPAAVNLVGWLFGTALDQQRFDSLKSAVNAVGTAPPNQQSPMSVVATTVGAGLFALSQARQTILVSEVQELSGQLQPALSDAAYQRGLGDTQSVLAVLDGLRQANPTAAAQALVKAHDALVAAVNDPANSYASLITAVGEFADQASALEAAIIATSASEVSPAKKGK